MIKATRPGRDDKPNEDFVTAEHSNGVACAVLLDGAGGPSELPTGCRHGTSWYVQHLGEATRAQMLADPGMDLQTILAAGIERVSQSHAATCDITDPGTPSATIIMMRVADGDLEWLVLGDSSLIIERAGGQIDVHTDRRIDSVAADLKAAMDGLPTGTPEHQAARLEFVTSQRNARNREEGYWIASTSPAAASHAYVGRAPAAEVTRVALISDGVARFVEFGLGGWRDLLDQLDKPAGPDAVFDTIRSAELTDPAGKVWPRAKRHDDVAVVFHRPAWAAPPPPSSGAAPKSQPLKEGNPIP